MERLNKLSLVELKGFLGKGNEFLPQTLTVSPLYLSNPMSLTIDISNY